MLQHTVFLFCLDCEGDPIVAQIGLIGVSIRDFEFPPIVADFGVDIVLDFLRSETLSFLSIRLSIINMVLNTGFFPFLNTLT